MKRNLVLFITIMIMVLFTSGCSNDAQVASLNLSTAADQFEIFRRVVFYNGITNEYILVVEGYCSIKSDTQDRQLELTVKTGPNTYLKHYLGLSDNVTYFVEQIEQAKVSDRRYRVIFKPSAIVPDIDLQ